MPCKNDVILFSSSSPLLCGIYENEELVQSWSFEGKTLDGLIEVLQKCPKIDRVFYARGPGSFTAIKLTHIFLQTLQITQGVELFATESFYFNNNLPIKAFGNQYFVKNASEIVLQRFEEELEVEFRLPNRLEVGDFCSMNEPLYILPPV